MDDDRRNHDNRGRRNTDKCAGEDCPQYLRQEGRIKSIGTSQYVTLIVLCATFIFQGLTYKSFSNFEKKYMDDRLQAQIVTGNHLIEMERLKIGLKAEQLARENLENRFNNWNDLLVKEHEEHMEHKRKYHPGD